jgi:hypothetical protein
MNWKLLLPLCLFGPMMGALMVMGVFPEGSDRFAWYVVVLLCAFLSARHARERVLLHGAVIGFWNGASATLVQALFFETTVRNNPYILEKFSNQPPGFDLEFFMFRLVPFVGVAGGAMTGLLAMIIERVLRRRDKPAAGETTP